MTVPPNRDAQTWHMIEPDGEVWDVEVPAWEDDPIAQHFGWVDGIPGCKGPICQKHEWDVP